MRQPTSLHVIVHPVTHIHTDMFSKGLQASMHALMLPWFQPSISLLICATHFLIRSALRSSWLSSSSASPQKVLSSIRACRQGTETKVCTKFLQLGRICDGRSHILHCISRSSMTHVDIARRTSDQECGMCHREEGEKVRRRTASRPADQQAHAGQGRAGQVSTGHQQLSTRQNNNR